MGDGGCISCGEELPRNDCPHSKRECGHHCDCSWCNRCCWCLMTFGDFDVDTANEWDRAWLAHYRVDEDAPRTGRTFERRRLLVPC